MVARVLQLPVALPWISAIVTSNERIVMPKTRTAISIRLAKIEELRDIVSRDQSPVSRLFDSKTASRAQICECALEVAAWVATGGMGKELVEGYLPEFKQRLYETDRNAFMRGAHAAANFLGAHVEIDAVRGVITITPPPPGQEDKEPGELDATPLVEPKIPALH